MKRPSLPTVAQHRSGDSLLRAIAISGVFLIHFLAGLDGSIYKTSSFQPLVVTLDQLSRISVPMFVALSGFGLMQKYQKKTFHWLEFLQSRVLKLLPLYIVWSILTFGIFLLNPAWRPDGLPSSLLTQIIIGRADYHLYFVPMIFQLYLLFPFLMAFVKKNWQASLLCISVFQVCLYYFYTSRPLTIVPNILLATDQQQYPWFFTWIFYFVLGMCLPFLHKYIDSVLMTFLFFILSTVGLVWAINIGVQHIDAGIDPIIALRFTRLPIMLYTGAAVVWLTKIARETTEIPKVVKLWGDKSYWVYLGHTMILRVIFTFF